MKVTDVDLQLDPFGKGVGRTRAFVSFTLENKIRVIEGRVLENAQGKLSFVFPARKTPRGWQDIIVCLDWRERLQVEEVILTAYRAKRENAV